MMGVAHVPGCEHTARKTSLRQRKLGTNHAVPRLGSDICPFRRREIDMNVPVPAMRLHTFADSGRRYLTIYGAPNEAQPLWETHFEIYPEPAQQNVAAPAVIPADMRRRFRR